MTKRGITFRGITLKKRGGKEAHQKLHKRVKKLSLQYIVERPLPESPLPDRILSNEEILNTFGSFADLTNPLNLDIIEPVSPLPNRPVQQRPALIRSTNRTRRHGGKTKKHKRKTK